MKHKFLVSAVLGSALAGAALFGAGGAAAEGKGEFGNHCALGLTKGMEVPTDCSVNWQDPTTKKTYCFASEAAKKEWAADVKTNIVRSESGYTAVLAKAHAQTQANAAMQQAQQQMKQAQSAMNNAQMNMQPNANPQADAAMKQAQERMKAGQAAMDGSQMQVNQGMAGLGGVPPKSGK
jgi:hypothetical protein